MCKCNELTIPIGPIGPQGIPGNNGTDGVDGTDGTDGRNGTNGIDGTNAFKFVKQFVTEDIEQTIVVPYAQWSFCGATPQGCLADETIANPFVDIHIQLWLYINGESPYWLLLSNGDFSTTFSYDVRVISATGDVRIDTAGNYGTYRLVILG
jgi:hypothetical protein